MPLHWITEIYTVCLLQPNFQSNSKLELIILVSKLKALTDNNGLNRKATLIGKRKKKRCKSVYMDSNEKKCLSRERRSHHDRNNKTSNHANNFAKIELRLHRYTCRQFEHTRTYRDTDCLLYEGNLACESYSYIKRGRVWFRIQTKTDIAT